MTIARSRSAAFLWLRSIAHLGARALLQPRTQQGVNFLGRRVGLIASNCLATQHDTCGPEIKCRVKPFDQPLGI